ncbi:MAG: type VI secretion system tip protein TssI/VgrG [Minicystis sp.]
MLELRTDPAHDNFEVRHFAVQDGINTLFSVDLVVVCENPAVDFEATIGAKASFRISGAGEGSSQRPGLRPAEPGSTPGPGAIEGESDLEDGTARTWSGVIADIAHLHAPDTGLSTYGIRIAPMLWLLTQRTNCRAYQEKSDLEVVLELLREWGLTVESRCQDTYKPRKYRLQYQESDFAFVSRLLEEAGINYMLEPRGDEMVIVLSDAPERGPRRREALQHIDDVSTAPPQTNDGGDPLTPARGYFATGFRATRRIRPGVSTFANHDPRRANHPLLLATATSGQHPVEARLEAFAYTPGAFKFGNPGEKDTPAADDRGRVRTDDEKAQAIAAHDAAVRVARSRRYQFASNCLELGPGTVLTMQNQPAAERAGAMLVTRIDVTGSADTVPHVAVEAASAEASYRPDRLTPRPTNVGVECATVVGPEGETIHCDEFGRVRVQFHWDRYGKMNELSSCWVPVNQQWAGEGFGMVHLPRVGHEVIVGFLGGNPEEPVIVGRMFTNLHRPPFTLPAAKNESGIRTKSVPETGGYNLLRFVDTANEELVDARAEKDSRNRVNHDKALSVGHDRLMEIANDDTERVGGTQREWVGKDQLTRVTDNALSVVGKDRTLKTAEGMSSLAKAHFIVADDSIDISVGSSSIHMDRNLIRIRARHVKYDKEDPQHHFGSPGKWHTGVSFEPGPELPPMPGAGTT